MAGCVLLKMLCNLSSVISPIVVGGSMVKVNAQTMALLWQGKSCSKFVCNTSFAKSFYIGGGMAVAGERSSDGQLPNFFKA